MGSSAVGSCIRCCRFRCAPGEGTLGIPAHYPRKHRWAGGPQLCCPRCATFTVAWHAGWGCIRVSLPRLPWSVRGPGLRPRPAHHRGRHPRIQPPRLGGGLSAPLWGFASSCSHSSLVWGLSISSPSLLNASQRFWVWGVSACLLCCPLAAASLHSLAVAAAVLSRERVDSTSVVGRLKS